MDKNEFSERLLKLRREKGLSQKELGDLLGVSNKAISKWENGESMPKTETMLKLAELLGIDGNELLGIYSTPTADDESFSKELDKLQSENLVLQQKIAAQEKKKKQFVLGSVILVAAVALITAIAMLLTRTGSYKNPELADVGQNGSKIVFNNAEYLPCNETQNGLLEFNLGSFNDGFGQRYAKYISSDSSSKSVTVEADTQYRLLKLKTKQGSFYYIDGNLSAEFVPKNVQSVSLNSGTIANNGNYTYTDFYRNYYSGNEQADIIIQTFCEFYNNLDNPVDKKITELYLGNNSKTVTVQFKNTYLPELKAGEFFEDGKHELYFYNYADAQSYAAGEELKAFVNK